LGQEYLNENFIIIVMSEYASEEAIPFFAFSDMEIDSSSSDNNRNRHRNNDKQVVIALDLSGSCTLHRE